MQLEKGLTSSPSSLESYSLETSKSVLRGEKLNISTATAGVGGKFSLPAHLRAHPNSRAREGTYPQGVSDGGASMVGGRTTWLRLTLQRPRTRQDIPGSICLISRIAPTFISLCLSLALYTRAPHESKLKVDESILF